MRRGGAAGDGVRGRAAWVVLGGLAVTALQAGAPPEAADEKPFRLGVIGLDTSHAVAFTKLFNDPAEKDHVPGFRVVAAFPHGSRDIPSSTSRIPEYTRAVGALGVEIVDSVAAVVERVDGVLLETNDGRPHLEQAAVVIAAGKPLFIDKPLAASLADCVAINDLAARKGVPVFTSSALRFAAGTQAVRGGSIGEVTGCDTWSPCSLEPTHPDLFWYGIHGCEALYTVMGTGCRTVTRTRTDDFEQVTGVWEGGRIGTFRGLRRGKTGFGGTAFGTGGIAPVGAFDGYAPLVRAIGEFFRTGRPPVTPEETLELYAFMVAADESRKTGGPVALSDVLAGARREAAARLAAIDAAGK